MMMMKFVVVEEEGVLSSFVVVVVAENLKVIKSRKCRRSFVGSCCSC